MPRVILIVGPSGSYKTSNGGLVAKSLFRQTGKPTYLITTDLGGYGPIRDAVAAGYVVPISVLACPLVKHPDGLLQLMSRLMAGWWPLRLDNGVIPADIKKSEWVSIRQLTPETAPCAAYMWEGMASTGQALMAALIADDKNVGQIAAGRIEGVDKEFGDSYKFGKGSPSHYGYVQSTVIRWLCDISAMPVGYVIVSSHESKGEDDESKAMIRGAGIVGKAATSQIPQNVQDFLHFDTYSVDEKAATGVTTSKTIVRAYFVKHPDAQIPGGKVYWDCKTRVEASKHDKLLKIFPGGYFVPTPLKGLDEYIRVTEELSAEAVADAIKERDQFDAARQKTTPKTK